MNIDELIRNKAYFFIDRLNSSLVTNGLAELEHFYDLPKSSMLSMVEAKWEELRNDITKNTDYYSQYRTAKDLGDFPVVSKALIASNVSAFHSKAFGQKKLVKVTTSGSYGTPLSFLLTRAKKKKQHAEVIYFGRKSGYDVGVKHGCFRSNPHKSKFLFWLQNETFFASKNLNSDFLDLGRKNLINKKIRSLIGFPSAISLLAKHCTDLGHNSSDFNVKGVITSSENLTKNHRDIITKAFDCPIHSRYSTEELGVLGNEYDETSGFVMNTCNYIIEVLSLDNDKSVNIGEIGRVVVTDLHSNAMPLIRYETGDLAMVGSFFDNDKKWVSNLKTLSGRTMQIIQDTKGGLLYPLYLDSIMEQYNCFAQYQLIQEAEKEYRLKLVTNSSYDKEKHDVEIFLQEFYNWLGVDAVIHLEFVDDIEKLPSGKRPYIINKLKSSSNNTQAKG